MSRLDAFRDAITAADVIECLAEDPSVLGAWQDEITDLRRQRDLFRDQLAIFADQTTNALETAQVRGAALERAEAEADNANARARDYDRQCASMAAEVTRLTAAKDGAYAERNLCVALIAKLVRDSSLEEDCDVWLGLHPAEDTAWEADWRNIVFVDGLGVGQMCWHIHDSELPLFAFLPRRHDLPWDGHTTEEKYERLREAVRRR